MHLVVICGGRGTRLGALTEDRPKSLVPVLGRPFLDWQLELAQSQGFTSFSFLIGHLGDQIKDHLAEHWSDLGGFWIAHNDTERKGPWHAYRRSRRHLPPRHAVIYGDSYLPLDPGFVRDCWTMPNRVHLRWRGEDYGLRFLSRGVPPITIEVEDRWHEVGTPEGIAELEQWLLNQHWDSTVREAFS